MLLCWPWPPLRVLCPQRAPFNPLPSEAAHHHHHPNWTLPSVATTTLMWPLSVAGLGAMGPLCTPERNSSKRPYLRVVMWVGVSRLVLLFYCCCSFVVRQRGNALLMLLPWKQCTHSLPLVVPCTQHTLIYIYIYIYI